jgi:hypothetical protein
MPSEAGCASAGDAADDLAVHRIDRFVVGEHALRRLRIGCAVGLNGLAQHALHGRAHALHGLALGGQGLELEVLGTLGDVDRAVGHALEIAVDLEHRAKEPEVGADGLVEGHEADDLGLDLDFFRVNLVIAGDDAAGEALVGTEDGLAGFLQHVLRQARHAQGASAKFIEQVYEVGGHRISRIFP